MKMKEICARTGLTERAVRLYCEEGLLSPERSEVRGRVYLEFSETHVEELRQIAILRGAGFSLDEIKTAINEPHLIGRLLRDLHGRLAREQGEQGRVLGILSSIDPDVPPHTVAALCAALDPPRAYENGAALRDSGPSFREFCESEGSSSGEYTELDRNIDRGRIVMTAYSLWYWLSFVFILLVGLSGGGSLLGAAICTAVAVLLFVYLRRGVGWIRVVLVIHAFFEAFVAFAMAGESLPSTRTVHSIDMNGVEQTFVEQTGSWLLVAVMLITALIYVAVIYFLGFNRWVSDYLYDRSTQY